MDWAITRYYSDWTCESGHTEVLVLTVAVMAVCRSEDKMSLMKLMGSALKRVLDQHSFLKCLS